MCVSTRQGRGSYTVSSFKKISRKGLRGARKGEGVAIMSIFYSAALGSGTWFQRLNSQRMRNPKANLWIFQRFLNPRVCLLISFLRSKIYFCSSRKSEICLLVWRVFFINIFKSIGRSGFSSGILFGFESISQHYKIFH